MIQVFTAKWCSACNNVKKFLKEQNIEFNEVDIDTDSTAIEFLSTLKLKSIPVTYFNGNYVVGYDPKKILELIKHVD